MICQFSTSRITACVVLLIKQLGELPVVFKEPIEKRRRLVRYFTSLASAAFFTKRKRGDGEPQAVHRAELSRK